MLEIVKEVASVLNEQIGVENAFFQYEIGMELDEQGNRIEKRVRQREDNDDEEHRRKIRGVSNDTTNDSN